MSNADRQKRYRDSKRNAQHAETVTRVTPGHTVTRTNPSTLNTGKPMGMAALARHKVKHNLPKYHNRVPIPGDHDYEGVCEQRDGAWKVRSA